MSRRCECGLVMTIHGDVSVAAELRRQPPGEAAGGFSSAVYAVTASYLITSGAGDRAVVGVIFGGAAVLLLPVLFTRPMSWVATGPGLAVATYLAVLTTALANLLYARGAAHHRGDHRDHARPGRTGRGRGPRAGRSQRAPDHDRARWPGGSRRRPGHRGLALPAPNGRRHI